jgi:ABC-type nitrate/sulfonate/bicarbonate transport system permease component
MTTRLKPDPNSPVTQTSLASSANGTSVLRRGRGGAQREWAAKGQRILRWVSPLVLFAVWELLARGGILDRRFFPPPSEIVESAIAMMGNGQLFGSTAGSLQRLVISYTIGSIAGVVVGLWLGLSSWSRALIEPWLLLTYPVPKLAIYPLLVLIVGSIDRIVLITRFALHELILTNGSAW